MARTITGSKQITFRDRSIMRVPTGLVLADRLGNWKARWAMNRMHFTVDPGIYAVGQPGADSPVFVSANYKMSFDRLRAELTGIDSWILVLDTKGINVWCAAGKGTFGTGEIVNRIESTELAGIVDHRKLIVPQLGAPGVDAPDVKKRTGFLVIYGPVRAADIPAFLEAGLKATDEMRRVRFPLADRVVLIPVELIIGGKMPFIIALCFFLLSGVNRGGYSMALAMSRGLGSAIIVLATYIAAVVLGPVLLPVLPGKAFSVKGFWVGLAVVTAMLLAIFCPICPSIQANLLFVLAWVFIIPAMTSFVVMNFTGASTYTSLSGVKREMKIALPIQAVAAIAGSVLWILSLFFYNQIG